MAFQVPLGQLLHRAILSHLLQENPAFRTSEVSVHPSVDAASTELVIAWRTTENYEYYSKGQPGPLLF